MAILGMRTPTFVQRHVNITCLASLTSSPFISPSQTYLHIYFLHLIPHPLTSSSLFYTDHNHQLAPSPPLPNPSSTHPLPIPYPLPTTPAPSRLPLQGCYRLLMPALSRPIAPSCPPSQHSPWSDRRIHPIPHGVKGIPQKSAQRNSTVASVSQPSQPAIMRARELRVGVGV
ncbi:uncharacterized protein BDZ99DRAFT_537437 [Mytilinidion resinicola]|uniref:Uncharacterized protein n=1 Tax=Mytilinidion resinicola TaxID=574789 RepID=A0A6A6YCX8_9PEZI|nr:uncharacterized protein BDZ99DRAFT_537437 [Mytilinidion resinicola]KAF2806672.1 hypothetical protein BDZ99DRAFT_537437 [Mytilinidion resinicola]